MKVLFCGLGSIGKRHLKNLSALVPNLEVYALKSKGNSTDLDKEFKIKRIQNLSELTSLDLAFITNPTYLHADTAEDIISKFNCPLFIEKPLDSNLKKAEKLVEKIKGKQCMLGYMMRFNKGLKELEDIIKKKTLGKVLYYDFTFQSYLPDWHPWEDYRISYAGKEEMGGGVIFTLIHEIDLSYWLFGEVDQLICSADHISSLEVNTEDYAEISMEHKNKIRGRVHINYFTKNSKRSGRVIFENGVVEWDFFSDSLRILVGNKEELVYKGSDKDFVNSMYVDMLLDFLSKIKNKEKISINEEVGLDTLKIAFTAKNSAAQKKMLKVIK